ncbi:MAG: MlaD family protein [Candidatus Binataceae bacterium]|jgi:paraquat-inducible protein B
MSETSHTERPAAKIRRSYLAGWVWIVPATAVIVVLWLAWSRLQSEGPTITIIFPRAEGIQAGAKIRHNAVDIGTVKDLKLTSDLSQVAVTAAMIRQVSDHLGSDTQFWIVRPRLSASGISGLETIVSGAYIEMQPGKAGGSLRQFKGLDQPPLIQKGQAGSTFRLHADQVRSLNPGSPLYYRGLQAGQVSGYKLAGGGAWVDVFIFVRAPYDKLVHHESLFWNMSAVSVSTSGAGLTAKTASLESLFAGGIGFDTPSAVLHAPSSRPGTEFPLYNDEDSARSEPVSTRVYYLVQFPGSVAGIATGSPVDLRGIDAGRVKDVHLEYDRSHHSLSTPVILELRPDVIRGLQASRTDDLAVAANDALSDLVARGLRARLSSSNLITGQRKVSLDFDPDAPPAHLAQARGYFEIPTAPSGDFDDLTQAANRAMDNLNRLLTSPELKRSMKSLDESLANLDHASKETSQQIGPLMMDLRKTVDQASVALASVNRSLGSETGQNPDLARAISELTEAARSIRILADYLDRHPEALLRGRNDSRP